MSATRPTLLLSVDYEDWHQLVRRRVGASNWREAGPALARQTDALLALLDELHARATFFVLGMAARAHPELLHRIVAAGHEIGCHGDAHLPVHTQTPEEFAADLRAARATIEQLTGRTPIGYRAPAFSITASSKDWAYGVLARRGLRLRREPARLAGAPRSRAVPTAATARTRIDGAGTGYGSSRSRCGAPAKRGIRIPVGGASYWQALPTPVILRGLARAGPLAGLYLHPNELDPEPAARAAPEDATTGAESPRQAPRGAAQRRAPARARRAPRDRAAVRADPLW